MEYIAESKNIKISPRKVRLVTEGIKKMTLPTAIMNLNGLNKRAATPIRKTLESAIANAVNNFNAEKNGLTIKEIMVNEGIMYKRYHYAARGRVRPYKKRTSHIRVVLEDNLTADTKPVAQQAPAVTAEAKDVQVAVNDAPVKSVGKETKAMRGKEVKQSFMKRITTRQKKGDK